MVSPTLITLTSPRTTATTIRRERIILPATSLTYFQSLVQDLRNQLLKSRGSREYYLKVIASSRDNVGLGESECQIVIDDNAVFNYLSNHFPEITLVDRCDNGSWTDTSRIQIPAPTVTINNKRITRTRGLISILSSIPIACSVLSAGSRKEKANNKRTSPSSPTIPSLSLPQLHFLLLALLAHSLLHDMNQHLFGTVLNQSKNRVVLVEDERGGGWLLDLMRKQRNVKWDQREEDCLGDMRDSADRRSPRTKTFRSSSESDNNAGGPSSSDSSSSSDVASAIRSFPARVNVPSFVRAQSGPLPSPRLGARPPILGSLTSCTFPPTRVPPIGSTFPPPPNLYTEPAVSPINPAPHELPIVLHPASLYIDTLSSSATPISSPSRRHSTVSSTLVGGIISPALSDLSSTRCPSPFFTAPPVDTKSAEVVISIFPASPVATAAAVLSPAPLLAHSISAQPSLSSLRPALVDLVESSLPLRRHSASSLYKVFEQQGNVDEKNGYRRRESVGGFNCGKGRIVRAFVSPG